MEMVFRIVLALLIGAAVTVGIKSSKLLLLTGDWPGVIVLAIAGIGTIAIALIVIFDGILDL